MSASTLRQAMRTHILLPSEVLAVLCRLVTSSLLNSIYLVSLALAHLGDEGER